MERPDQQQKLKEGIPRMVPQYEQGSLQELEWRASERPEKGVQAPAAMAGLGQPRSPGSNA